MKKGALFFFLSAVVLCLPALARADFFDPNGGKWWMDKNSWDAFTVMDYEGRIKLDEVDNNLVMKNAPAWNTGWSDGYEGASGYVSKWGLSLNADFAADVDYHLGYYGGNWAGFDFAVGYSLPGDSSPRWASTSIGWDGRYQFYYLNFVTKDGFMGSGIYNEIHSYDSYLDGFLTVKYQANTDTFQLEAFRYNGAGNESIGKFTLDNIKTTLNSQGVNSLQIGLLGATGGADLSDGQTYFTNFKVDKGVITPEPISCALFLVGAGALAGARKLRKG